MRIFRRICNEVDTASMPAKMHRMARARLDRVNSEYQRATRVVERLLQAHGGGYREEQKRRDDFRAGRVPDSRTECEDSIPIERRSTLPVNEILAAERWERSWESAAAPGRWSHPNAADRGREVGDLDVAGLNIGAPTRLRRGGGALPPAGVSTPLGGNSGELPRTYSGSSARTDYRRRLELNAQDSDEDVLFQREMNYPERGVGGFSDPRRAVQGRAEGLRLCNSRPSQSTRQRTRRAQKEAGDDTEVTRTTGPALAAKTWVGASTRRIGGPPDAGEKIRIRQPDYRPGEKRACSSPGEVKERARLPRRSWGLDWRRFRA
jgi:hypothetical protein